MLIFLFFFHIPTYLPTTGSTYLFKMKKPFFNVYENPNSRVDRPGHAIRIRQSDNHARCAWCIGIGLLYIGTSWTSSHTLYVQPEGVINVFGHIRLRAVYIAVKIVRPAAAQSSKSHFLEGPTHRKMEQYKQ